MNPTEQPHTLTHEEIDALEGRELRDAVTRALDRDMLRRYGEQMAGGRWFIRMDHDAALALCEELGCDIAIHFAAEPDCWWRLRLSDPSWAQGDFSACGKTIAEAALRCWLKWKLA